MYKYISSCSIRFFSVVVFLLFFATGCFFSKEIPLISPPMVISGFSSPESIIADPDRDRLYVSNVGELLEPSKKDGDGFISELAPDGTILRKRFLPEEGVLHAPKGMAIVGSMLYVADIDRIIGFDLDTRKQTFLLDFSSEKTVFLNDIAVFDGHSLLVSATDTGKIYKIFLDKKPHFILIAEGIPGVNGLYYDQGSRELYIVSFGDNEGGKGRLGLIRFSRHGKRYQKVTEMIGLLDGVALLPGSNLVISDWVAFGEPGMIRVYDLIEKELFFLYLSEEIRGPADLYYDKKTGLLWVPKMQEGKILVEKINL